ncbi:hypothetical protein B5V89_13425 [Heyndrickxia sporothermodurans]|nr:hypothetical protein B5V89_13425 [Heyndrickxia sporothermodurans]
MAKKGDTNRIQTIMGRFGWYIHLLIFVFAQFNLIIVIWGLILIIDAFIRIFSAFLHKQQTYLVGED